MGEVELAVLITVLLVGLLIGVLLPWASLLISTGQAPERTPLDVAARRAPRREAEAGTLRAALGAFLAIAATTALVMVMVPSLSSDVPAIDDLPGRPLVFSTAALLAAIGYALPSWVGVRR